MKVLLTGAAGFIGSCFLRKLNDMGIDEVYIVDTHPTADQPNLIGKKFVAYLSRESLLEKINADALPGLDLVVHLGACADTTERDVAFLDRNNIGYSRRLAEWALETGARFHYASSAAIYGSGAGGYDDAPPAFERYAALNPYGESKRLFDAWVYKNKLDEKFVGYRYFNVFGPNEYHKGDMKSMVAKSFDQIRETGRARLFATTREGYADGSEQRDFIYVKDVVDAMAYFVQHADRAGIFNLGTGQARSFKDLVTAVFSALKREPAIDFVPMPEKLRGQYQYFTQATVERLRAAGYTKPFRSLEDAVSDYVGRHLSQSNPYY